MKGEVSMVTDVGQTAENPVKATPCRRWLQFSLRTPLVLVFGYGRGWLAYEIKRAGQLSGAESRLRDLSASNSRAQPCGDLARPIQLPGGCVRRGCGRSTTGGRSGRQRLLGFQPRLDTCL